MEARVNPGIENSLDILDENGNYLKEDYILQADN